MGRMVDRKHGGPIPKTGAYNLHEGEFVLSKKDMGVYNVAVSVGRSRQTQLEEGVDEIGQLLQAQPQLMPLIGPIYWLWKGSRPGIR